MKEAKLRLRPRAETPDPAMGAAFDAEVRDGQPADHSHGGLAAQLRGQTGAEGTATKGAVDFAHTLRTFGKRNGLTPPLIAS